MLNPKKIIEQVMDVAKERMKQHGIDPSKVAVSEYLTEIEEAVLSDAQMALNDSISEVQSQPFSNHWLS